MIRYAGVAELADALDLGSSGTPVQVQVLSPAPISASFLGGLSIFYNKINLKCRECFMYIWTAINVEKQLREIKHIIGEIEKQVGIIDSVVNLPLHISLKISFEISDDMYADAVDSIINYYKSVPKFDIEVSGIEKEENIIWIRMEENRELHQIHRDLDKLVYENYGILPHKFDLDYKFHTTLFMDSDCTKIAAAYNIIKDAKLPQKVYADHLVIGSSKTGVAGTYIVDHNIKI